MLEASLCGVVCTGRRFRQTLKWGISPSQRKFTQGEQIVARHAVFHKSFTLLFIVSVTVVFAGYTSLASAQHVTGRTGTLYFIRCRYLREQQVR